MATILTGCYRDTSTDWNHHVQLDHSEERFYGTANAELLCKVHN